MACFRENWRQRAGWFAIGAAVLLSGTSAFAQQLRDQVRQVVEERIASPQREPGSYWIGIACEQAPEVVRAQLGLDERQGVLLLDVVADAPAAKSGLKKYDVILAIDDRPIGSPEELARAVVQSQGKELTVRYLRAAKEATVAVQPVERPRERNLGEEFAVPGSDQESFRHWLERFREPGTAPPPFAMRFFHPGMLLPPGASAEVALPDDMSVTISKHARQRAKIHVERGEKSWDVTEDKLQDLPADVRVHVERMLGRATFDAAVAPQDGEPHKRPKPALGQPQLDRPGQMRGGFEAEMREQMDRLNDRLRELQEAVDKLNSNSDAGQR